MVISWKFPALQPSSRQSIQLLGSPPTSHRVKSWKFPSISVACLLPRSTSLLLRQPNQPPVQLLGCRLLGCHVASHGMNMGLGVSAESVHPRGNTFSLRSPPFGRNLDN